MRLLAVVLVGVVLVGLSGWSWWAREADRLLDIERPPANAADFRQQQLLEENIDRPGDRELIREYLAFNRQYFDNQLPMIPVRWEPALDDVGALAGHRFSLEGMVGRVGTRLVMLLNPKLQSDRAAFERALAHEMAHVHVIANGGEGTHHGPEFQAVLRRLAGEGAFQGIAGSEAERKALKAWLDGESARLDADERELAELGERITRERAELESAIAGMNDAARSASGGKPAPDEVKALEVRRDEFNRLVLETNTRLERGREALAHFNAEVARYNLMIAYPDGMDEGEAVPAR